MLYKYFLRFKDRYFIRLFIRNNAQFKIKHSSIYQSGIDYYILLLSQQELYFADSLSLIAIDINNIESVTKKYIYDWAISELDDSIRFIWYETNSTLNENARVSRVEQYNVKRLFMPLSEIFAIINYTADSFSDGGKYNSVDKVLSQIISHLDCGARIIDVGVESTNPNVSAICATAEIKRLKIILPEVIKFKHTHKFKISIDTYHTETVKWLLDQDIDIINDVSGNLDINLVKELLLTNRHYVAMHSLSVPVDKDKVISIEQNPIHVVKSWMRNKIEQVNELGLGLNGLILDPGIGFGKNSVQSWYIIRNLRLLRDLPCEILLGHSRKSFFKHMTNQNFAELDLLTAIMGLEVISEIDYLRLHDLNYFNQLNPLYSY